MKIIRTALLICGALLIVFFAAVFLLKGKRQPDGVIETSIPAASQSLIPSLSPALTPTPVPTLTTAPVFTPTPEPSPEPFFLDSLEGYAPGDVIENELIDTSNLGMYFTISEINEGDEIYQRIYGQSYIENPDIGIDELRYLKLLHVNFDGNYQVGELIVNASVASQVTEIFEQLCEAGYEIYSMYLIDDFWVGNGTDSDTNSIDHNNTSCFCYRPASGSSHISLHALGLAIDLNPQQNPYVRVQGDGSLSYSHENASEYVENRSSDIPHVITEEDYAYQLFAAAGWTWGGSWSNPIDYQHFQLG